MGVPQSVRDRLLVEAGHRCTVCAEKCFEIHHIVERRAGGGHDEDNLIVLCPNCHQQRVHRNGEFTPKQLRMYKEKLREDSQVERRLLLDLEEIREALPAVEPAESERRLRAVVEEAARVVSQDRAPRVFRGVADLTGWLAEREMIKGGARRAIEVDWEIARAREKARFGSPVCLVAWDEGSWTKARDFEMAYSTHFVLSRVPCRDWVDLFEHHDKNSYYMMRRRTTVRGDRVEMIVGERDDLQRHVDHLKHVIQRTNAFIEQTVFSRIDATIDENKARALREFDAVASLKERSRAIKI